MERWFALITQRAIRRGSFGSVKDLVEKIGSFVHHYNRSHRHFVWTATTDDSQAVLLTIFPLLEELPERFQTAEFLEEHGLIDRIVHRKKLRAEIAEFICYFATTQ